MITFYLNYVPYVYITITITFIMYCTETIPSWSTESFVSTNIARWIFDDHMHCVEYSHTVWSRISDITKIRIIRLLWCIMHNIGSKRFLSIFEKILKNLIYLIYFVNFLQKWFITRNFDSNRFVNIRCFTQNV